MSPDAATLFFVRAALRDADTAPAPFRADLYDIAAATLQQGNAAEAAQSAARAAAALREANQAERLLSETLFPIKTD